MLNLAFWNLGGKNCGDAVIELGELVNRSGGQQFSPDVILGFSEPAGVNWHVTLEKLGDDWSIKHTVQNKFVILSNIGSRISRTKEMSFSFFVEIDTFKGIQGKSPKKIIVCFTHVPSAFAKYSPPNAKSLAARDLRESVSEIERDWINNDTVLIGDLNMDPFDSAMVDCCGLNATMCRQIALQQTRECGSKDRKQEIRFFYNPMWALLGDRTPDNQPGSMYHSGDFTDSLYWHCFDQVLLRPTLIPFLAERNPKILTRIGSFELLTHNGVINRAHFSDHLPVAISLTPPGDTK
jgi:hypothetical protein